MRFEVHDEPPDAVAWATSSRGDDLRTQPFSITDDVTRRSMATASQTEIDQVYTCTNVITLPLEGLAI